MDREKNQVPVERLVEKALEKKGEQFIRLAELAKLLDQEDRKRMGLTTKSTQADIKSALSPLPSQYNFINFKRSEFLLSGTPAEVAIDFIKSRKPKTFKQFNASFPMLQDRFRELVNQLLDDGRLKVRLSKTAQPILYAAPGKTIEPVATERKHAVKEAERSEGETALPDIELFKQAYDEAGKGANYVFIHQIRRRLNWPRSRFDNLLLKLMAEGYVAAHPGNPGALGADEVTDSFQDEYGDLYITISWRKEI